MKMTMSAGIVLTSLYTVIAMVVAGCTLQQALLTGISTIATGFALLTQIDVLAEFTGRVYTAHFRRIHEYHFAFAGRYPLFPFTQFDLPWLYTFELRGAMFQKAVAIHATRCIGRCLRQQLEPHCGSADLNEVAVYFLDTTCALHRFV